MVIAIPSFYVRSSLYMAINTGTDEKKVYGKTNESSLGPLSGGGHLEAEHTHLEIRSGRTGHVEATWEAHRTRREEGSPEKHDF